MSPDSRSVRRGLPRTPGGDPWPPARELPAVEAPSTAAADATEPQDSADPGATARTAVSTAAAAPTGTVAASPAPAAGDRRRGLPRTPGGEPWPPASTAAETATFDIASVEPDAAQSAATPARAVAPTAADPADSPRRTASEALLRRGLPREPGGEPWPPAGHVPPPQPAGVPVRAAAPGQTGASAPDASPAAAAVPAEEAPAASRAPRRGLPRPGAAAPAAAAPAPVAQPSAEVETAPAAAAVAASSTAPRPPLPFTRTAWAGIAASAPRKPKPAPERYGPFTRVQWVGAAIVGGGGLLFAAAMAVALVRWFLSLDAMQDWLVAYPGETHLPQGAPVGFPAWLNWSHFLNTFFILLIIRTGLQVRREKRPTAFWTPRWNNRRKISLALWFHQALDILWVLNGVVFVVLLFVSGQWMRIVPTSWDVFPNALSAALQYVSLDWPTENGWVNYNSLQVLAYFTTTFVAAPLAIVTGVRMSGIWPKNASTLNRLYPVEWARKVHFPVMLYFVAFIVVHVALVFATGALRNLNHMYAAQGSTDPNAYADNWLGFAIFALSMLVLAAGWVAARPLVLAPIAGLFGTVKGR